MIRLGAKKEKANVNLAYGMVAEEINSQKMMEHSVEGGFGNGLINNGGTCTLTNDCRNLTGVVHYSQWGAFCR